MTDLEGNSFQISRRRFILKTGQLGLASMLPLSLFTGSTDRSVRFGITTDSHFADRDPIGTRYYRQSLEKMQEFVEVMNKEKVDFVIHMGDFKDEDAQKESSDTLSYLRQIESVYGEFVGPRFHCVGNHDVDSITKTQFLENVVNTGIAKTESYFSFDLMGFHFIVLDANYHKNGEHHYYKLGADWQDTNIPEVQLNWLANDLKQTDRPTLVFCHHPLFEFFRESNKYHINNYVEVQKLMEASKKVKAVFQGHVHAEETVEINGIWYATLYGMVDYSGKENNSFAIVEVNESSLTIDGYYRVADRQVSLN